MTKYQEYYQKMVAANKDLFDSFRIIHDAYALDSLGWQAKFNAEGEKVLSVIRDYENRLCSQSEKGGYGVFTGNLAEKFQAEVKKAFPLIDHVGLVVKNFNLKKIKL
jgi:hypothetical protein